VAKSQPGGTLDRFDEGWPAAAGHVLLGILATGRERRGRNQATRDGKSPSAWFVCKIANENADTAENSPAHDWNLLAKIVAARLARQNKESRNCVLFWAGVRAIAIPGVVQFRGWRSSIWATR
jgi:hypothetical protein